MEAMEGRPAGQSVRSLSYWRMFSASALILLTLLPYARSAWYPTRKVRGSKGAMAAGFLVLRIINVS